MKKKKSFFLDNNLLVRNVVKTTNHPVKSLVNKFWRHLLPFQQQQQQRRQNPKYYLATIIKVYIRFQIYKHIEIVSLESSFQSVNLRILLV